MKLTNLDKVTVETLEDGAILIFCKKQDLDELNFYINEKAHDVFIYLTEKETSINYGKKKFNYNLTLKELYEYVALYINEDTNRMLDPAYIQLYRFNDQWNAIKVTAQDRHITLKDLLYDSNCLEFDELPFPLADVTGKNVVKV